MVQRRGKRTLFIALGVLIALVLVVGLVAFVKSQEAKPVSDTSEAVVQDEPEVSEEAQTTETPSVPEDTTNETAIDPEQVSTTDIEPMMITVSYMKGIEGFEFEVKRNPNGTQYVQFSSTKLVGTKCTNDVGVFASIIEKPTVDESATLTKTTTVDGTSYGLSLTDSTCTPDAGLLKQYQDAFSAPFTLLKKM